MLSYIKNIVYNLIYSKSDIIFIDNDLIKQIIKRSNISATEANKLYNLKDKNFINEDFLLKELNDLFNETNAKNILIQIIEARHNLNGRPSNQNYPLF